MRKLRTFAILLAILLVPLSFGDYRGSADFLASDYASIASTATYTKTSWTRAEMLVCSREIVAITIEFTIATANGDDIDFYFQASFDGGATWSTDEFVIVDCASDIATVASPAKHTELVNVYGISHLRLWKVVNGDAVTAITAVNATMSWGR